MAKDGNVPCSPSSVPHDPPHVRVPTTPGHKSQDMSSKKRVSYFYHGDVGHYYYGPGHPMKVRDAPCAPAKGGR